MRPESSGVWPPKGMICEGWDKILVVFGFFWGRIGQESSGVCVPKGLICESWDKILMVFDFQRG